MHALCSLVFALFATSAFAQAWPSKPIRWIVPYAAGGSSDTSARPIADKISKALGQPVIVENRPGATGNIGAEMVAKSAPDGYTLLNAGDWLAAAPHLFPKLGYDPFRDFTPVTQLVRQPIVLAVHASLGINSVAELVAYAKKNPGAGFASSGTGNPQHFVGEWFAKLAGIELTHIPYKGGGQAITDFIGGQVKIAVLGSTPLMPHYKAGKIKLLAQSLQARAAELPEIPTFEEAGYKGLVMEQWQGVLAPAGTPANIIARLNAEMVKALSDPGVRERYATSALEPVGNTPEQMSKVLRENYDKFGRLVRELNIKVD
jgi:tripartite-type tricarboxylate transporter receptor subunit TctC